MKCRKVSLCVLATVLLVAGMLADWGGAQTQQTPTMPSLYRVSTIRVNPGMGLEWQNFVKNDLLPLARKSGATEFQTWTTEFGDPDNYVLLAPVKNMAELDGKGIFATVGQEEMTALMAKLQKIVNRATFSLIQTQNNLTIAAKPGYVPKIGILVTNTVAVDREADFINASKAVMTAAGKTNMKGWHSSKLALGGNPNNYYTLVLLDAFADTEQFVPAFVKAIMEVKLAPQPGVVLQRQYEVLRYVPELSIQPAAQ